MRILGTLHAVQLLAPIMYRLCWRLNATTYSWKRRLRPILTAVLVGWAWLAASGRPPVAGRVHGPARLSAPPEIPAQDSLPPLVVGRTYFVTASVLYMRPRPAADTPGNPRSILCRNWPVTVLEVTNRNWVFVRHQEEDAIILCYVSRWYLSEQKVE